MITQHADKSQRWYELSLEEGSIPLVLDWALMSHLRYCSILYGPPPNKAIWTLSTDFW